LNEPMNLNIWQTHTDTHEPSGRQHPEHLRIRPGDAHAVNILVTSAAGTNGDGYGSILAFTLDGKMLGAFGADSGITDPRGLRVHPDGDRVYVNNGDDRILSLDPHGRIAAKTGPIANLNPGRGNFGPDGRYYIGSRTARTIVAFPPGLLGSGKAILPSGVVPFPRGFALAPDGRLFLASGTSPSGDGDDTILAFAPDLTLSAERFVGMHHDQRAGLARRRENFEDLAVSKRETAPFRAYFKDRQSRIVSTDCAAFHTCGSDRAPSFRKIGGAVKVGVIWRSLK